jgi:hypothetical protein
MEEVVRERHVTIEDVRAALEYAAKRAEEGVAVDDPLTRLAGIVESHEPGWADHHDAYFGGEGSYAWVVRVAMPDRNSLFVDTSGWGCYVDRSDPRRSAYY